MYMYSLCFLTYNKAVDVLSLVAILICKRQFFQLYPVQLIVKFVNCLRKNPLDVKT